MLRQLRGSQVGRELLDLMPGDTAFGWSVFASPAFQPYGHTILYPHGFDPATSLDHSSVAGLAHEMVHVLQRVNNRPGMCDNCTTLYSEMEAYIIGYAIEYDLAALPADQQAAKSKLLDVALSRSDAYTWLESRGGLAGLVYRLADETAFYGSGDWRDTLKELGFSDHTITHIRWIIAQP